MPVGDGLGRGFGKNEEYDGYRNSGIEDAFGSPDGYSQRRSDCGSGGVDQVIAQQNGGKQLFRLFQHPGNAAGTGYPGAEQVFQPYPLQGNKGGFRAGKERRQQDANDEK